ncbi:MAG: cytochrome c oxidase assembly protein, partial [Gammaproteobacteria bacterium]
MNVLNWLLPYEFSPTVAVVCGGALVFYVVGAARLHRQGRAIRWPRHVAWGVGVLLIYAVLQTRFDYLSQHMFFIHRIQHLALHHLGPFLIVIAAPGAALAAALPERLRRGLRTSRVLSPLRLAYAGLQQPLVAATLFVALIYLWLIPTVHFYAMINIGLYNTMNWSMAIDGLLFWYLILGSRPPAQGGLGYGWRLLILGAIIVPQDIVGAYIALCNHDIYKIYAICGRIWSISPMVDQQIGGLVTWIPSAMMSSLGAYIL